MSIKRNRRDYLVLTAVVFAATSTGASAWPAFAQTGALTK
jgi:Ubiquitinol-cytochrome C reductase Fe-S subunit TAT signal